MFVLVKICYRICNYKVDIKIKNIKYTFLFIISIKVTEHVTIGLPFSILSLTAACLHHTLRRA